MIELGLIGKKLGHSFSPGYFTEKFRTLGIEDAAYHAFELDSIDQLEELLSRKKFKGLNVTIPYKQDVIPYLDEVSAAVKEIGACNTIVFKEGKRIGHNTDFVGFRESLRPLLNSSIKDALVLGTGGAAKAVQYALSELGIRFYSVSRTEGENIISYNALKEKNLSEFPLIINTTPLGMFPKTEEKPDLKYEQIGSGHILFDLVYNPEKTSFLLEGEKSGCRIKNGLEMLHLQADAAWKLWS